MAWQSDIPGRDLLGVGVYSPSEAAMYIRVRPDQLMGWLYGSSRTRPVLEAQFAHHREMVSFLDMVQAMAIRAMRREEVPLPRIRQALEYLKKRHPEVKFPFAQEHKTFIIEPRKQLAILLPEDDADHVLEVSGKHRGQYVHARMLDEYLKKLRFGPDSLAVRFIPMERGKHKVVLDPLIRFGQPRVEPSGLLVETLVEAARNEGSIERAAWWYEVDEQDVRLALDYQKSLGEQRYAKASQNPRGRVRSFQSCSGLCAIP